VNFRVGRTQLGCNLEIDQALLVLPLLELPLSENARNAEEEARSVRVLRIQ